MEELIASFRKKGEEFSQIIKMGRTQLEDAVPMTLGQTFNGFASILQDEIAHLNEAAADSWWLIWELPLSVRVFVPSRDTRRNVSRLYVR